MAREYHSPSSVELASRCMRAAAYRYIDGFRYPEVEYGAPALIPEWVNSSALTPDARVKIERKAKAPSLGKAVHSCLENRYLGIPVNWSTFPGQVAQSGLPYLPEHARPEASVGIGAHGVDISPGHDGKPRRAIIVAGIAWHGFVDADDSPMLPHFFRGGLVGVYDYKSTREIARYAKSAAELTVNLQANLYAYDRAIEFDQDRTPCRWVYFETQRVRRAKPVDFVIERGHALEVIEQAAEIAREFDKIERSVDAPMNPRACGDYGGCEFHESVGGPCSARVSYGALIQARVPKRKVEPMGLQLSQNAQARLANFKPGASATTPAAPPSAPEAPAGESEPEPQAAPPPAAARPGRPPKAKAKPAEGSLAQRAAEAAAALAGAEQAKAQADADYEAALAALRAAVA